MSDLRPADCRFRLQDEGKAYPRSYCEACKRGITTGLGRRCHREAEAHETQAARIAELEAEVARLREAFVWCADAPMCATLEALGEDVEAACLAWDARQPADYNQTLDDARSTLRALTGGDDRAE